MNFLNIKKMEDKSTKELVLEPDVIKNLIENLDIHKIKAEENRNCFLENIKLNDMIILMYFHKKLQSMFFNIY